MTGWMIGLHPVFLSSRHSVATIMTLHDIYPPLVSRIEEAANDDDRTFPGRVGARGAAHTAHAGAGSPRTPRLEAAPEVDGARLSRGARGHAPVVGLLH